MKIGTRSTGCAAQGGVDALLANRVSQGPRIGGRLPAVGGSVAERRREWRRREAAAVGVRRQGKGGDGMPPHAHGTSGVPWRPPDLLVGLCLACRMAYRGGC